MNSVLPESEIETSRQYSEDMSHGDSISDRTSSSKTVKRGDTKPNQEGFEVEVSEKVGINFETLGISSRMVANLEGMGFTSPTPIQEEAIPKLLSSKSDFIGLASTGTGKTGAFGIPLVENLNSTQKVPQGLVLCPTRELALQVADQLVLLGKHVQMKVATIYGGASYRTQMDSIKRGAQIIVATPGRLVDFLEQRLIDLSQISTLILDEADEMISMGFQEDLEFILQATQSATNKGSETAVKGESVRAGCKTWLFSATMSPSIRKIADRYLDKPQFIQINKNQGLSSTVEQLYYCTKENNKLEVLSRILQINRDFYGIIFCQTKQQVADIDDLLRRRGFAVDCLHGDKTQRDRELTLKKFKSRSTKIVIATDVAARGLDIKELTHVVNFSLPWDVESYIHRSGRTGRNNQKGIAISLVSPAEMGKLTKIQRVTRIPMKREPIPTAEQVALNQIHGLETQLFTIDPDNRLLKKARTLLLDVADQETGMYLLDSIELFSRMLVLYHPEIFTQSEASLEYVPRDEFQDRDRNRERGRDHGRTNRPRQGRSFSAARGSGQRNEVRTERSPRSASAQALGDKQISSRGDVRTRAERGSVSSNRKGVRRVSKSKW